MIARPALVCWLALASACGACSEDAARVKLVPVRPVADSACGDRRPRPSELVVIAYAPSGEQSRSVPVDDVLSIGDFPADTEQIGVEARLAGSPVAIGKTPPLDFEALADGATVPIFMVPPDGFCPLGGMRAARRAPLVATAGDGVLIVGGFDAAGNPLSTAERFDPATGTFVDVEVPSILGGAGFAGATLTSLPDGRVVLAGGPNPAATIYNPATHAFGESILIESRTLHAALATERQLLLIGGCSSLLAGCTPRFGSKLYEATEADTLRELAPGTTLRAGRLAATLFEIGPQLDGKPAFVLAGGRPPVMGDPDAADVFSAGASDAALLRGSHAQAALLDGGAILTAFAPEGDPPSGAASVFAPGAATARTVARAPDLAGARLARIDNGRVVAIGGDPGGDLVRYDPMIDQWERVDADGPVIAAPVLHALADGNLLVLGGEPATNEAFLYRPPLLGASSGAVTVVPIGPARANVLTPSDPATVTRAGTDWILATGGEPIARALVGGPRMERGTIRVVARVRAGGIGLVAQQRGPGQAIVAEIVPGAAARLVAYAGGAQSVLCSGAAVAPFDRERAETMTLEIADGQARVRREGADLVACAFAGVRGAWGVAAIGPGGEVAVDTVAVTR